MPSLLNRIEREYIVENMRDTLPALSVKTGADLYFLPEKKYTLRDEKIYSPEKDFPVSEGRTRVFFMHKFRGMFFDSDIQTDASGTPFLPLPDAIYMEDIVSENTVAIKAEISGSKKKYLVKSPLPPLFELAAENPETGGITDTRIQTIIAEMDLPEGFSHLAKQIDTYLAQFKNETPPVFSDINTGHFLFADNLGILVSLRGNTGGFPECEEDVPVSILTENRSIKAEGRVRGFMPVDANLYVFWIAFTEMQEEDKRYLFERQYGEIFR
ncbi:hypothetical protein K7I13_02155 [Brucepastera parasyntrophica]|uniref:hypothetical protein n=1 Tax=Brucepastera parasyntrophica TaxID=2880008 RepID=UPI00210A9FED|nr:hypothetical protein [Brucepastera parasyntrophica]ULQ60148.1 hypothetical protein K7I13_02155 [Brucepastera parasyntrophica]